MKKLALPFAVSLVFLFFRFYMLFSFTELTTGFILKGRETLQLIYNAGLAVMMGALYLYSKSFSFKKESALCEAAEGQPLTVSPPLSDEKSCFHGGKLAIAPLFIAAMGLGLCSGLSLISRFRFSATLGLLGILSIFIIILIVPVSVTGKVPKGRMDGVLMLIVVCFSLNAVMCIFLGNNTISKIPQNYFSLLSGLLFVLAIFFDAKKRAGLIETDLYFRINLLAAVFITATAVPNVVAFFANCFAHRVMLTTPIDIALISFVPYLWFSLATVLKNCEAKRATA